MRYYRLCVFLLLLGILVPEANAQDNSEEKAIYIVRHGEKSFEKEDPELTEQGQERAERLKKIFEDKDISSVYSSDTRRTRRTIMPFADEEGLGIKIYDPTDHGSLVDKLYDEEGDVVVIGHSNTIHHLVNLLIGQEVMEELDETDYDNIFIVFIDEDGNTRLERKLFHDFEEEEED